jgi:hypothetical protein
MPQLNTFGICSVNTQSFSEARHDARMESTPPGRRTKSTPSKFWERLAQAIDARPSCKLKANPTAIAKSLGLTQGGVRKWYTGESLPELETGRELALRTGVCLDWLYTAREPMYPGGARGDPFLETVMQLVSELSESERARTIEYLQFKADHARSGWANTVDEAIERVKSETGRFRKPS